MSTGTGPVFVHSLFRSGSTYLFTVFRRARDEHGAPSFTAFQEALHEVAWYWRRTEARLLEVGATGEDQILLRHPDTGGPYFKELFDTHEAWADIIAEKSVYDVFGAAMQTETADYFRALIRAAPHRPVFQECRTSLRIRSIREAVGGTHIHLWRNPWDQWWSMRVTRYFDTAIQMFLNAPGRPVSVDLLRNRIQFPEAPGITLDGDYVFFQRRPPVPSSSYKSFYLIWLLSLEHGLKNTQVDINIESLSGSPEYRQHTVETLRELGVDGLNLDDSAAPVSYFGDSDRGFFEPLEEEVHQILRLSGWTHEQLSSLLAVRKAHDPLQRKVVGAAEGLKKALAQVRTTYLETERDRATDALRAAIETADLTSRVQGREADAAKFAESLQAALYAQAAEASDNRVRLDAELAETRHKLGRAVEEVRDVHLRLQATIGQLAEANEEIKNTHLRLQDALGQEMERSSQLAAANAEIRDVHLRLQASLGQQQELAAALTAARKTNMALRNVVAGLRRQSEQTRAENQRALQQREEISQAFRDSFSWRLTAPVRALTGGARATLAQGREAARALLKGALRILRTYPVLKTPVMAVLSVNPALKERLTNFGQRHRLPGDIVAPKPESSFLLTPEPGKVEIWAQVLQHPKAIPTAGKPT